MVASWQEYRDKQTARAEKLGDEALAAAVSKAMISAEARMGVVQMRMCAEVMASGENPSALAEDMSEVRQALGMVKAAHEVLTRVVARQLGWPIPTEGDR
tara:strand:+ start:50 stop:349 length:300 start_codon:yes stop_codon:yes gene_type:complete